LPWPHTQARSQEARNNWESALDSKDRAIAQLEEALQSRQRTLEQLTSSSAASADAGHQLQVAQQRAAALEAALNEAQGKVGRCVMLSCMRYTCSCVYMRRVTVKQLQLRLGVGSHAAS
jgi:hypothetical protein